MRAVLVIAVVVGCGLATLVPVRSQPPAVLPASAPAETDKPYGIGHVNFLHRPATSCAAAACHGGGQVGKVGSEHTTWAREAFPAATSDPHANAYNVLFNPVSVQMGKILKLIPHQDARCLTCHAVDSGSDPETREQIRAEGVGCGACHGPAEKWIAEHTLPSWKARSNREKWTEFGFVPTKNVVARTLNCASCHVGDRDRDMNHDFIAAGHPRLAFESARFHYQPDYRKHWTEQGDPRDFEVRAWIIGQAATLRAAANLLHERAKRAAAEDKNTPWPEFSGLSCYACHQKIGTTEVRGAASDSPRPAGKPGWEVWSNTAVGVAADSCGLAFAGLSSPKLPQVEKLRTLMESKRPIPSDVALQAKAAVDELDSWLVAMQTAEDSGPSGTAKNATAILSYRLATNAISKDRKKLADHDWDALAANYLGCAAMHHAAGGSAVVGKAQTDVLLNLRDNLRFPLARDGRFNSPADLDLKKLNRIRDNFDFLRNTTAIPGDAR